MSADNNAEQKNQNTTNQLAEQLGINLPKMENAATAAANRFTNEAEQQFQKSEAQGNQLDAAVDYMNASLGKVAAGSSSNNQYDADVDELLKQTADKVRLEQEEKAMQEKLAQLAQANSQANSQANTQPEKQQPVVQQSQAATPLTAAEAEQLLGPVPGFGNVASPEEIERQKQVADGIAPPKIDPKLMELAGVDPSLAAEPDIAHPVVESSVTASTDAAEGTTSGNKNTYRTPAWAETKRSSDGLVLSEGRAQALARQRNQTAVHAGSTDNSSSPPAGEAQPRATTLSQAQGETISAAEEKFFWESPAGNVVTAFGVACLTGPAAGGMAAAMGAGLETSIVIALMGALIAGVSTYIGNQIDANTKKSIGEGVNVLGGAAEIIGGAATVVNIGLQL